MWKVGWLVAVSVVLGAQTPGPLVRDPNASVLLGQQKGSKGEPLPHLPSATVEVTGVAERDAEHIRALTRWMAPALRAASIKGYDTRESVQFLSDFMLQDPSRPKPPRVMTVNAYANPPVRGLRR